MRMARRVDQAHASHDVPPTKWYVHLALFFTEALVFSPPQVYNPGSDFLLQEKGTADTG